MGTTCGRHEEVSVPVEPPANVLCRAPSLSHGATDVCPAVGNGGDRNLLLVALSGNPDRRLQTWKRHGSLPEKVGILSVEEARGAVPDANDGGAVRGPGGTAVSTTTIPEPDDLTGIGIKLNQCLSAWAADDAPTHVCFDSVTTLLQFVDTRRAFRFLHVVAKRVRSVGGLAHYHVDPGAHDEQTLATVAGAFSNVYDYDESADSWSPF